ncbi:hypothetical protein [Proteus faecis]
MIDFILKLIPILLVFITWHIVYINATKIASRAESKSINDEVVKIISSVNELSMNYWLKDNDDGKKNLIIYESKVLSELHRLHKYNEILNERKIGLSSAELIDLHEIITLDSEKRLTENLENDYLKDKVGKIIEACSTSQINLYNNFHLIYDVLPPNNIFIYYKEIFGKKIKEYFKECGNKKN